MQSGWAADDGERGEFASGDAGLKREAIRRSGDPGFHEDCSPFAPLASIITAETLKAGKLGIDHCMSVEGAGIIGARDEACIHIRNTSKVRR